MTDAEFVPDHTHATAHRVKQLQQLLTEARAEVDEWRHLWHEASEVARERGEQIARLAAELDEARRPCGIRFGHSDDGWPCILPAEHVGSHRSIGDRGVPISWETTSIAEIFGLAAGSDD